MEALLVLIMPIVQVIWYIALAFGLLSLVGVAKQYLETKSGTQLNIDWSQVVQFASKAVLAVKQIYQVRPDNMSDEDWNNVRYAKAEDMVIAFAKSLGFEIDKDFLDAIKAVIESAVAEKKAEDKRLISGTLGTYSRLSASQYDLNS